MDKNNYQTLAECKFAVAGDTTDIFTEKRSNFITKAFYVTILLTALMIYEYLLQHSRTESLSCENSRTRASLKKSSFNMYKRGIQSDPQTCPYSSLSLPFQVHRTI